jgi:parvulin-like peptidyl-prolyl isomerase
VHVEQILLRKEADILQLKAELDKGTPFDTVAAGIYPPTTVASRPWDLAYLKWDQLPEQWQAVLDGMKNGDTSAVLRGPRSRFWLIKLIDRRMEPGITFESVEDRLKETIKRKRVEELQEKLDGELRARAHVEYSSALP